MIPGTEGYEEIAQRLVERYEVGRFEEKHSVELHLLERSPCRVMDVGAGSGADAAWFARQGHRVLAVEPTTGLRTAAAALHQGLGIEWLDDSLPELKSVRNRQVNFDLIVLFAVWMHLDRPERSAAMATMSELLAVGGTVVISLRHGKAPLGRRMFDVEPAETVELAESHGLKCVLNQHCNSFQPHNQAAGVTWTKLAFKGG